MISLVTSNTFVCANPIRWVFNCFERARALCLLACFSNIAIYLCIVGPDLLKNISDSNLYCVPEVKVKPKGRLMNLNQPIWLDYSIHIVLSLALH